MRRLERRLIRGVEREREREHEYRYPLQLSKVIQSSNSFKEFTAQWTGPFIRIFLFFFYSFHCGGLDLVEHKAFPIAHGKQESENKMPI